MAAPSQTASSFVLDAHRAAVTVLSGTPRDRDAIRGLPDAELLELGRVAAAQRRFTEATIAAVAGEITRRSDPALGDDGLARSTGARTPEVLIQELTGSNRHSAIRDAHVGRMLSGDDEDSAAATPWLAPVREAMRSGEISADQASAISRELGAPNGAVASELLQAAASELVGVAGTEHADRVRELARDIRNELDADGASGREAALHAKRSLRRYKQDDGTTKVVWVMDPETAAVVGAILDRAISPRLGGPRFVDPARAKAAAAIVADPRTTEQLASDVMRDLLAAGAELDGRAGLGRGTGSSRGDTVGDGAGTTVTGSDSGRPLLLRIEQPAVKIVVTADALSSGGAGHLEGSGAEVSIPTIERAICNGTVQRVAYTPSGQAIDVGRDRRLFTGRQREALAVKWGGCAIPGCDRPPTWTEYHHIEPWSDGGPTDTGNGLPLCRCHHADLHNRGWTIRRTGDALELHIPGRDKPLPLRPKGRAWRQPRQQLLQTQAVDN